jgi:uncharacterized protein
MRRYVAASLLCGSLLVALPAHAEITLDDLLNAANIGNNGLVMEGIRRGMYVDSSDETGLNLLMRAAREGNMKLVDFLIRNGASLDTESLTGDTAIKLAVRNDHLAIVQRLVEAGAAYDYPGWSPIAYAAFEGHDDIVRYLLAKGASPDSRLPNKATPMHLAARNGHIEVIRTLLAAKADPNAQTDRGESIIKWALDKRNTDIADLVRAAGGR